MNQPIFITGAERSGSTLIAKILNIYKIFSGIVADMHENVAIKSMIEIFYKSNFTGQLMPDLQQLNIPINWKGNIQNILKREGYEDGKWMYKSSYLSQTWPIWNYAYPNARWIIVRRRTGDIIQSCIKTGFMDIFKNKENLKLIGAENEEEGWKWWVHQYEKRFIEMIEAGLDCKIVWPERMVHGDYQQIYEMLEWLGLPWKSEVLNFIDPKFLKSRLKK